MESYFDVYILISWKDKKVISVSNNLLDAKASKVRYSKKNNDDSLEIVKKLITNL